MSDAEPKIVPMEVAGNRLTLLADGPERLEALIALIDGRRGVAARPLLHLGGRRGRPRGCAMRWCAAAERGVQVSLLVDGFGAVGRAEGLLRSR